MSIIDGLFQRSLEYCRQRQIKFQWTLTCSIEFPSLSWWNAHQNTVKPGPTHWRHNGLQWSAYPVLAEQIRSQQCMPFQIILYDVLVSHYCLSYVYYHDWSFKWVIELIYQLIFHRNTICQKCTMFQYQCNNLHKIFY